MLQNFPCRVRSHALAVGLVVAMGCTAEPGNRWNEKPRPAHPQSSATSVSPLAIGGRCSAPSLAVGDNHTCVARPTGQVFCWGNNSSYQGGLATGGLIMTPTAVAGLSDVAAVTAGTSHTCALINDGTVKCWGAGGSGQLGDGTTTAKRAAPQLVSGLTGVVAISAGSAHTCALKGNGTVWCWGNNGSGRLGDASTTRRTSPVQAAGITNATVLAAGGSHTCAATSDGRLLCWGSNAYGQLGDGSTTAHSAPAPVDTDGPSPVNALTAGATHTCAIFGYSPSTVQCWGRNNLGQLARDDLAVRTERYPHSALTSSGNRLRDGVTVSSGPNTTCAILGDGSASCWGSNAAGQVGDGATGTRIAASTVNATGTGLAGQFLRIGSGASHTCALAMNGDVYCWGSNTSAQLGTGNRTGRRLTPGLVSGQSASTFGSFAREDQLSGDGGASATSIIAAGDTLLAAGLQHATDHDAWVIRRSLDRGANWTTAGSYTYSYAPGRHMGAPHIARREDGTLFVTGAAENEDGDTRWVTIASSDGGDTWSEGEDFAFGGHQPARANGAAWIWDSNGVMAAGSATDDTSTTHWILRQTWSTDANSWVLADDYVAPGSTDTQAHGVVQTASHGLYAVGHYTPSTGGAHMLLRRGWFEHFSNVDDFQYAPDFDTIGRGIASDLSGRIYALARAEAADGTHWILRRYDDESAQWGTVEIPLAPGEVSEPTGLFVDGSGAVNAYGKGARPTETPHAILRTSYDHGATWSITAELATNLDSSFLAAAQDPNTGSLHLAGSLSDGSVSQWEVRSRSCLGLVAACGNGVVDPGEICDGNCSNCDDNDACTTDTVHGDATACNVTCTHATVDQCSGTNLDGCCPAGCTVATDLDCCTGRIENGACVDLSFKLTELGTSNCTVREHNGVTGDDRGGIAVSLTNVFYTSDGMSSPYSGATARFNITDLLSARSTGRAWNSLVSDLKTGAVYSLSNSVGSPINGTDTATQLVVINGTSGAPTSTRVRLSSPISVVGGQTGIFAGYGRFLIHNGARVYDVQLPSGTVRNLGAMTLPDHTECENWAFWGVAESFDGALYIDYVMNPNVYRTRVPDGETSILQGFTELSDMCSFTFSPSRHRWYFHHEGISQFRPEVDGVWPDETIGFCDGRYARPNAPQVCGDRVPEGTEICDGDCPTNCSDGDACTTDTLTGAASSCNAVCVHTPVLACVSGDGCCPAGCVTATDSDCATCGDGIVQMGEACDDGNTADGDGCSSSCQKEECTWYTPLTEANRNVSAPNAGVCDSYTGRGGTGWTDGWYRIMGDAGTQLPESSPAYAASCGTWSPGWLNGMHPAVADGAVDRQVCFGYSWGTGDNNCVWSTNIQVRNCGSYYVYRLPPTPLCSLRYCGAN